jgi:integrase
MRKYLVLQKGRRIYRGRFCLDGESRLHDVSLHTSDKQVAEQRLNEIVREKEREKAGILLPQSIRDGAQRKLTDHLKEYIADQKACGRAKNYISHVEKRIKILFNECGWAYLKDVTSDSFQLWRSRQSKAPKTLNDYLAGMCGFFTWLERHGRVTYNPLKAVVKVETRGQERRLRRAYTDEEASRLIAIGAEKRGIVYLMAAYTGLRRGELSSLQWADLELESSTPHVKIRASTTKNHDKACLPLKAELVKRLLKMRPTPFDPTQRVFFGRMPRMSTFKKDLQVAKIPFLDIRGRRADFHSLRHTLATNLSKADVPLAVEMKIMRHSDPRLSLDRYTDKALLPTAQAIQQLPDYSESASLAAAKRCSLIRSLNADISGADESLSGNVQISQKARKTLNSKEKQVLQSSPDNICQTSKMVRAVGIEPTTSCV